MPRKADNMKLIKLLLLGLGVLIVALIVVLIVILAGGGAASEEKVNAFITEHTYIDGISVAGVDISGLTYDEAAANAELVALGKEIEDSFSYALTAGNQEYTFTAAELGITSSLLPVLEEAMLYGQYGSEAGAQRKELSESGTKNFDLVPYGDISLVTAKITELKTTTLDVMPQDATLQIADDVLGEGRFTYIDEVVGVDVDANALATLICSNINSGNFASVEAPAILTNPKIDVEELKANTQLISTMTTSYEGSTDDRITNIRVMSGVVNGTVIQPGVTWSINAAAGPRNAQTAKEKGWAEAHGITNGRYEDQFGGGVCQVSGTLYNAAIRAELTIVKRYIHSWPSVYVPEGLDATINYTTEGAEESAGTKDVRLANPFDMPVYLAAYMDEEKEELTIEVYGPPLAHGYRVEFVTIKVGSEKAAPSIINYDSPTDPDGTAITLDKTTEWITPRDGQTWEVWKQYYDTAGNLVKSEFFSKDSYRAFQGVYYVNGPNPLTVDSTVTAGG